MEQVGPVLLDRPAPQAIWKTQLASSAWAKADAVYKRSSSGGGTWKYRTKCPNSWFVTYNGIKLKIKLTDFGHLGFFPEHADSWTWMQKKIRQSKKELNILNMFAYTGAATLAIASVGAKVTHLDAAKGIVTWARENAELSGLADRPIRWMVDDVSKFLLREIKRGNKYDGLILDPPSYGRGSRGEVWKFETEVSKLLEKCRQVLSPQPHFVILSAHTPGFSSISLKNMLEDMMPKNSGKLSSADMYISDKNGRVLPSGIVAKWENK